MTSVDGTRKTFLLRVKHLVARRGDGKVLTTTGWMASNSVRRPGIHLLTTGPRSEFDGIVVRKRTTGVTVDDVLFYLDLFILFRFRPRIRKIIFESETKFRPIVSTYRQFCRVGFYATLPPFFHQPTSNRDNGVNYLLFWTLSVNTSTFTIEFPSCLFGQYHHEMARDYEIPKKNTERRDATRGSRTNWKKRIIKGFAVVTVRKKKQ